MNSYLTIKNLTKEYPRRPPSDPASSNLFNFGFLETINQGKSRFNHPVLKDVNLEISAGEIVGLIGANGAGKTTLLKCISKVTSFSSGEIKEHTKVISIINLIFAFEDNDTVSTSIKNTLQLLGVEKIRLERIGAILDWTNLESLYQEKIGNLSTGMRAKLALGIIFHADAKCILFDEVLAVGDISFREKVSRKILDFSQNGGAVLLVSHDLDFIRKNSSRVIVLNKGVLSFDGQVVDGIEHYLLSVGLYELDDNFHENRFESGPVKLKFSGAVTKTNEVVEQFLMGQPIMLAAEILITENIELQINFDIYCENVLISSFRGAPFCVKYISQNDSIFSEVELSEFPFDNNYYKFRVSIFIRNIESKNFYPPIKVTTKSFKFMYNREMNDFLEGAGWAVAWSNGAKIRFNNDYKIG